ncbi:choline/ethanolamine kinase-like isoform X1 [Biomphalaria glabrata]|uniref:Choline/ethanolamine kinase-like isoform X1 n=2 Tax=Biomphalaria glabrata TaxID=6526 RepID=A0A9W3BMP9_BIOGL|nr:choline/ethanolamine kinase-like isoform X1 [Biomphalaria glabrata]XP_055900696.1 choline/ethanolamine kinase-like isoform X1 [Biomphalaria glabrata]XP_055900697.1 choline/ethanolamine kinase-like isoform X1 [Biomphalaria glabrata]XP_055900698.1 choline/ethanolamine kinase-like isoform X1 [Biomphalaria glabrata]KAI8760265.1 choline/ethanolamine kinase-like [Biomphalaria glabrata]KAI8784068.1 choline/ethanolamine kinase [Biomphalaria glabrata]
MMQTEILQKPLKGCPNFPREIKLNNHNDSSLMIDDTDTGNDTDRRINPTTNGPVSKDVITDEMVRNKAFRWCQDSIGGAWLHLTSEKDLQIEPVGGGMSNYLYLITLPKGKHSSRGEPEQVLLRIYGQISKSTLDFLVHNSVVFALLAERKLGPKPYGMYHDGRIEEFIKAKPLKPEDLCKPEVMVMVAEKLAQFHSLDMPLCKKPRWFKSLVRGWIRDIQNNLDSNSVTMSRLQEKCPLFNMDTEFNELLKMANDLNCPIVFCHNDLQGGNILLADKATPQTPRMTIIDWEYGHYNYRGFDLGNHFNEWMFDYTMTDKPGFSFVCSNFPSKEKQFQFFKTYLKASGKEEITPTDLVNIYIETNTLALHSHFTWGVWAMVQAQTSSIDFDYSIPGPPIDYSEYALTRFDSYFKLKKCLPQIIAEANS